MANIFDYIDWRGDLDLTQDPFNEVDSLILSTVSYIDFELIETDLKTEKATIREAGEQFNRLHADEKIKAGRLVPDSIFRLLDVMSRTPRFRDMILSDYVMKRKKNSFQPLRSIWETVPIILPIAEPMIRSSAGKRILI